MSVSYNDYNLPNSYNYRIDSKIKSLPRKSGCPVFGKGIFTGEVHSICHLQASQRKSLTTFTF